MPEAALVGFSLGGMIVRKFALAYPARSRALAILNSPHDRTPEERAAVLLRVEQAAREGPRATVEAALTRWFNAPFAAAHPEVLERVRDWILANDPAVYPLVYRMLAEGDAELARSIAAIACPALVLTGGADHGNSPDMARRHGRPHAECRSRYHSRPQAHGPGGRSGCLQFALGRIPLSGFN